MLPSNDKLPRNTEMFFFLSIICILLLLTLSIIIVWVRFMALVIVYHE